MSQHSSHNEHSAHNHDHSSHSQLSNLSATGAGAAGPEVGVIDSASPTDIPSINYHNHNDGMDMGMSMFFHTGLSETILFQFWTTNNDLWLFLVSWLIIFIVAFMYEGLKFYRERIFMLDNIQRRTRSIIRNDEEDSSGGNNSSARIPVMIGNNDNGIDRASSSPSASVVLNRNGPFNTTHLYQTFLHMVQIILSYSLMLVFMTYNVWLCGAVVLGAGVGYVVFGWRRNVMSSRLGGFDVLDGEHCQ